LAVRLRLTRVGGKKDPVWRVVVADQRSPRDGRVIETIGRYNPQTQPSTVVIDEERARDWLQRGAQPSKAVRKLLRIYESSARASQPPAGGLPMNDAEPDATPTRTDAPAPASEPVAAAEAPAAAVDQASEHDEEPSTDTAAPEPLAPADAHDASSEHAQGE
jgi:small subunit ribosomal protein S16